LVSEDEITLAVQPQRDSTAMCWENQDVLERVEKGNFAGRMKEALKVEDCLAGMDRLLEMLGGQLTEISKAVQGKSTGVSEGDDNEDRKRIKEKLVRVLQRIRFNVCGLVVKQ
jgi:hypothetical protein